MSLNKKVKKSADVVPLREEAAVQVKGLDLNVRERIRSAIIRAGGPKVVSTKGEIPLSTLTQVMSGRSEPKARLLTTIATVVGVSLDWIMFGDGDEPTQADSPRVLPAQLVPAVAASDTEMAMIPFFDVRASAGPGALVLNERPTSEMALPRQILRQLDISPANAALMGVQGDSAEPTLSEGDLILVNRALRDLRNGCMYVIGIDDDVIVKRVERLMDGSVVLKSDNPAYSPQTVPAEEVNTLRVIGRVRWALHQL